MRRQAVIYALVGVANTAIGLVVIFVGLAVFDLPGLIANAIGYAVGFAVSFVLNGKVTFRQERLSAAMLVRFLGICALAYAANAICVVGLAGQNKYLAQAAGVALYTVFSFFLCRRFVFGDASVPHEMIPARRGYGITR